MTPLATTLPELVGKMRVAVAAVTLDFLNDVGIENKYRYYYLLGHSRYPQENSIITCSNEFSFHSCAF
jgi:hypothetical protein